MFSCKKSSQKLKMSPKNPYFPLIFQLSTLLSKLKPNLSHLSKPILTVLTFTTNTGLMSQHQEMAIEKPEIQLMYFWLEFYCFPVRGVTDCSLHLKREREEERKREGRKEGKKVQMCECSQ